MFSFEGCLPQHVQRQQDKAVLLGNCGSAGLEGTPNGCEETMGGALGSKGALCLGSYQICF